ncbi:MAG: yrrB 5 [Bacteroidota bacterium]|jgi:serine phosphatase RsbU (regulator of sigma subunit)|nr:yrrB 5 [Bacteroidota bacterium]
MKRRILLYVFTFVTAALCQKAICQDLNIDSCLRVLKTLDEDTNKVILLNKIAWHIAYSNLQTGMDYSNQSIELAEKLKFETIYSRLYNTRGAIFADKAEVAQALNDYISGLKYAKKYNQNNALAALYNSLGNMYGASGESRKALSYYLLSVDAIEKSKSGKLPIPVYSNLVGIYNTLNMFDSAMYYVNLCIDYNTKSGNKAVLATNYISLSEIYTAQKLAHQALGAAEKAALLARDLGDDYTISHALVQLGNAHLINGNYKDAFKYTEEAIVHSKKTGDLPALEQATLYLSQIYEATGDFKNSLKFFKEYKVYQDSALNKESIQQVKNAEAKYESEKKQKEIELLHERQKVSEAEGAKKKMYLYAAIAGILALAVILIVLYRNNRLKQKTNRELEQFNVEVNKQKNIVEEKNKEITDSINYARRIQQNILTNDNYFKRHTSDFFILFKPKDIVSGDFYWALNHKGKLMVMTADCTGHGVPGAMMSMMGINFLNEIVNEKHIDAPESILNQLRSDIIKMLNPEGSTEETKDGMDCCLCSFDFDAGKLRYSNANNKFYLIRSGRLLISETNKMPVGAGHSVHQLFQGFEMELQKGDLVVTLTDGYADQFGGPKGKKFKYKQLEQLLENYAHLPLFELKEVLDITFENWKGNNEQIDDVCLIGIKV